MTGDTPISEREREILRLVAMGATNQQIAQKLDISINTVKVHLRNIFGKIGVASRTEATVYAIRQGLVEVPRAAEDAAAPVAVAELPLDVPLEPLAPVESGDVWNERVAEPSPAVEAAAPARPASTRWWLLPVTGALALAVGVGGTYLARPQPDPAPASVPTASAEAAISRWQGRAELPRPRGNFAVAAIDGRLYVVGGGEAGTPSAAVDRYDPANNVWVELTDKPTAASDVKAVAIGRFIYVPGGEGAGGEILDVLEAYDPRSQQWERLPNLPAPRSRYALASLEGRLYLFGGWDGSRYCDEVFVYDPASRTWSEDEQRLPTPRRDGSAAAVEGRLYVFGGENEAGALRVNERYDPAADEGRRWESAAPLSQPVAQPASVGILNFVLLFDADRRGVMQYSPASDSWTMVDLPADVAVSSRAAFLGSSVFVFGASEEGEAVALSEYQPLYNIFLPSTSGNS